MGKKVLILIFVLVWLAYPENDSSEIHAEYCLTYDSESNCGYFRGWLPLLAVPRDSTVLKISKFIKNVDFPKSSLKSLYCGWHTINISAYVNNEKIPLSSENGVWTIDDRKSRLRHAFDFINPWQCYGIQEEYYDLILKNMTDDVITIEWQRVGTCEDKDGFFYEETLTGTFNIRIKGECTSENLKWNAEYNIHQVSSPIDTMDFGEYNNGTIYDSLERKLFENKWMD
jgi:hypothetical protein